MDKVLDFELRKVKTLNRESLPAEVRDALDSLGEKLNPIREELADLYRQQFMLTRKIQNA